MLSQEFNFSSALLPQSSWPGRRTESSTEVSVIVSFEKDLETLMVCLSNQSNICYPTPLAECTGAKYGVNLREALLSMTSDNPLNKTLLLVPTIWISSC